MEFDPVSNSQTLADLDGTRYVLVALVYAVPEGGAPSLFCSAEQWPATMPARLVEALARIDQQARMLDTLATERDALHAQIRALPAPTADPALVADVAPIADQEPSTPTAPRVKDRPGPKAGAALIPCPACGKECKGAFGLKMHQLSCAEPVVEEVVAPVAEPVVEEVVAPVAVSAVEEVVAPPFRCVACRSSTHAQSIHEPSLCIRCAAASQAA